MLRTILALFEGEFDTARQSIRAGLDFAQKMRSRMGLVAFQVQSSMLKAAEGKFDEGIALVERSVAETPTLTAFRCILAGLYAEGGRTAEARVRLDELAEDDFEILPDNDKLFGWSLLGEVCYLLDDPTHASRLYELLSPYAERNVVCHPGCAIGSAARYLGLLASSLSRWDRAERQFERALELNEEMNARPWLARTQEDFAHMLFARDAPGDRERAGALTRLATTAYRAVGMQVRSNRRGP